MISVTVASSRYFLTGVRKNPRLASKIASRDMRPPDAGFRTETGQATFPVYAAAVRE